MSDMIKLSDYIRAVMEKQRCKGNPRKWIVLRNWNQIVDHDAIYTLKIPPVGPMLARGTRLWAMESTNSPALVEVSLLDDQGATGLWVQHSSKPIQWLVAREDAKVCPMPYRPLAIMRKDLHFYLGKACADEWHAKRREGQNAAL